MRDTLFLIRAPFEDSTHGVGATWFCHDCAALEGALLANAQWLRSIDVRRLPFPRPRLELIALIGEENQGMPVLILGDADKAPADAPRFMRRAFITDPRAIARYLAATYGGAGPHREPRNGARLSYGPDEFARDLGLEVSRETLERLEIHRRLLEEWSARMNLIGPKELEHFWLRHALDSAQLVRLASKAKRWLDLGSGAGLPGLVIAGFVAEESDAAVHLVESTGKKAAFLRAVAEEAALPVRVFNQRIEDFGSGEGPYEVVTARALAPLPRLILYAKPFLDRGAQGLFHKGADTDAELAAAKDVLAGASGVSYRADVLGSLSDPRGRIIRVVRDEG